MCAKLFDSKSWSSLAPFHLSPRQVRSWARSAHSRSQIQMIHFLEYNLILNICMNLQICPLKMCPCSETERYLLSSDLRWPTIPHCSRLSLDSALKITPGKLFNTRQKRAVRHIKLHLVLFCQKFLSEYEIEFHTLESLFPH